MFIPDCYLFINALQPVYVIGVELSNICVSVNECDDHHKDEVSTSYHKIKECLEVGEGAWDREVLLSALTDLGSKCREGSPEQIVIAKTCLYSRLAVNTLMDLLSTKDVQISYKALTVLQVRIPAHTQLAGRTILVLFGVQM